MISLIEQLITWSKGLKLLYVEDDIALREELSILLSDIFDVVDVSENGEEGLRKISENNYDLIITDIRMPVMNGIEMIEKLKREGSKLPIVVFSAHNESEYLLKLINLGIDNFVTKPIKSEQVFSVLHKVIESIHKTKELRRYEQELEVANAALKKLVSKQSKSIDFKTSVLKSYRDALYEVALVSVTTPEGVIKDVNDNFCKALGFTKEEIIGNKHSIFKHPSTDEHLYKEMWEMILAKKIWHGMLVNQTKTFQAVYHYTTIIPILDDKDNIYEFIAIKQDLTKIEEANKAKLIDSVKSSHDIKKDEILNILPFASVIFDKKSKITHYNKLFENFITDLIDVNHYTKLVSKTLHVNDVLEFKGLISLKDNDFVDTICEINETINLEAKVSTVRGVIDFIIKIKKLDANNYMGSLVCKEDLETCFLVQES